MSRRRSLAEEAAQALFTLTSGAGLFAGILWALDRPVSDPAKSCSSHAKDALGKCVGDSLITTLKPYVLGGGTGLFAGALTALTIIGLFRLIARSRKASATIPARTPALSRAVTLASTTTVPRGRAMNARYPGTCSTCHGSIRPGDRITHLGRHNNRCAACS